MAIRWTLKELAKQKGLTGYQIAELTGISRQTIYKIMREPASTRVDMRTLATLCDALKVEPGDLLARDKPKRR